MNIHNNSYVNPPLLFLFHAILKTRSVCYRATDITDERIALLVRKFIERKRDELPEMRLERNAHVGC